jgi:aminopeptidase N
VAIALGQMETSRVIGILRRLASRASDGRVKRMAAAAIKKVQGAVGSDQNLKSIQGELDELKKLNQELKSRLAESEAKAK